MVEIIKIDSVSPAVYNPRKITEAQIENLKMSLQTLGFAVPILVNSKNNVIIAGHQRTKAARSLGVTEVPAIKIDNVAYGDEIKFNQLHNGVDVQRGFSCKVNTEGLAIGEFIEVDITRFVINNYGVAYVKEICNILLKYGNVLSAVLCRDDVIIGANYIRACEILGMKPNCFVVENNLYDDALRYLKADYGVYSYENIKKNTYVQGLAQLSRSTQKVQGKRQNRSTLYENRVFPYLSSHKVSTILDFGCGKGAYINELKKSYNAIGVEFYNNNGSQINISKGNAQIDELIDYLRSKKTFDVVVCDSVLNSVDSMDAERSVMACLNLFCGERLFVSGRSMTSVEKTMSAKKDKAHKRFIRYLDENGFTGDYRKGNWYFQKYHKDDDVKSLLESSGFEIKKYYADNDVFQVEAVKNRDLTTEEYIAAIDFEFNLPLPNDKSYNRHNDIKKVLAFI